MTISVKKEEEGRCTRKVPGSIAAELGVARDETKATCQLTSSNASTRTRRPGTIDVRIKATAGKECGLARLVAAMQGTFQGWEGLVGS